MTTITLQAEIEGLLEEEAQRRGTTPERLALHTLRFHFILPVASPSESNLADFLAGYVGLVEASNEPLSERCGERLAQGLAVEKNASEAVTLTETEPLVPRIIRNDRNP